MLSGIMIFVWILLGDLIGLWKIMGASSKIAKEIKKIYIALKDDSRMKNLIKPHITYDTGTGKLYCVKCKKEVENKGIHLQTQQIRLE